MFITRLLKKFANWYDYHRGIHRLKFGFCPRCNSSPPQATCPICKGDYDYGLWREKFSQVKFNKFEFWRKLWDIQHLDRFDKKKHRNGKDRII